MSSLFINNVRKSSLTTKKQNKTSNRAQILISLSESLISKKLHLQFSQFLSKPAVFVHSYISEMRWSDWATFPSTVLWQTNSAPNSNTPLSSIEEMRICAWRRKQLTCSEFTKIVVNDLCCASEVACPLFHIAIRAFGTNNEKAATVIESVVTLFCAITQSRIGISYIHRILIFQTLSVRLKWQQRRATLNPFQVERFKSVLQSLREIVRPRHWFFKAL